MMVQEYAQRRADETGTDYGVWQAGHLVYSAYLCASNRRVYEGEGIRAELVFVAKPSKLRVKAQKQEG